MSTQAQRRPDLERVAILAMKLGGRHLADYGARAAAMISRNVS